MDDAAREELATLRTRAYGPDADIDSDSEAFARLRELERQSRIGRDMASSPGVVASAAASAPVRSVTPVEPAPGAASRAIDAQDVAAASAPPTAPERPIGRALLIGWAASIAVVAVVVGALVFGLASLRPVSAVPGARQVASLDEPTAGAEIALPWMGDGNNSALSYRFSGLLVMAVVAGNDVGGRCLTVTDEVASPDGYRVGNSGCSAGPFFPTVSIEVTANSPDQLKEAFPIGTALQFVWDGTAVGVFAADPPPPSDAPA